MEVGTPMHAALVLQADELAADRGADINAIAIDLLMPTLFTRRTLYSGG